MDHLDLQVEQGDIYGFIGRNGAGRESPTVSRISSTCRSGLSSPRSVAYSVDHLDLQVEQGDIYGFIGRNGAGKSTTLKLLCGLIRPTQARGGAEGLPSIGPVDNAHGGL